MEQENIKAFKEECRTALNKFAYDELCCFARSLNMRKPTVYKKADLIEDIIRIFCGELVQTRVKSGQPAKNRTLNPLIAWEANRLITRHQIPNLLPPELLFTFQKKPPIVEAIKPPTTDEAQFPLIKDTEDVLLPPEGASPCLRIVVFPAILKKKQRKLLFDFLNSL